MEKSREELRANHADVMSILLIDQTTKGNIIWATDDNVKIGTDGFGFNYPITLDKITGANAGLVVPRAEKSGDVQKSRSKAKAEVFTPSWICNDQNNRVDEQWFGRKDVFNRVTDSGEGIHRWIATDGKIGFPERPSDESTRSWFDYVMENRLDEITCGEAPYLVSRCDAVTREPIPVNNRIGLLDRKLRVVSENTEDDEDWMEAALWSVRSVYGYEWQGDSLLMARENVILSVMEYYRDKFGRELPQDAMMMFAYVISWNIWQMDGLKFVVPGSCHDVTDEEERMEQGELFATDNGNRKSVHTKPCPGCAKKNPLDGAHLHNGIYCRIMNWVIGHEVVYHELVNNSFDNV